MKERAWIVLYFSVLAIVLAVSVVMSCCELMWAGLRNEDEETKHSG